MNYDAVITKFKRGGSAKLEAAHELIISVYDYIYYLAKRYHPWLFYNRMDDVTSFCHLYLLDKIHTFDPEQCRFVSWSRLNILNALADYYGRYEKPVVTSRRVAPGRVTAIYLGVPDNISTTTYNNNSDPAMLKKLRITIINKFDTHHWNMWNDYCGFDSEPLSLRELSIKYGYNSKQAIHVYIVKIRNFLKNHELIKEIQGK